MEGRERVNKIALSKPKMCFSEMGVRKLIVYATRNSFWSVLGDSRELARILRASMFSARTEVQFWKTLPENSQQSP